MKKVFLCIIILLLPAIIFADVFGLKMGMTLEEIEQVSERNPQLCNDFDCYYFYPLNKHPMFKYYYVLVNEEKGLYCIRAETDTISSNIHGKELLEEFTKINERISKVYGKSTTFDIVDSKEITSYTTWVETLGYGYRDYYAKWDSNNKDDLESITLTIKVPKSAKYGYIVLEYYFTNKQEVEDLQDNVF